MRHLFLWVIAIAVVGAGAYFLTTGTPSSEDATMEKDATQKEDAMMEKDTIVKSGDAMMDKGSYESYAPEKLALAEKGKVLLYFHADWCPICRGLEAEIQANASAIPPGVHILKVDYDTATSLKQKYGVTYQHTFVQVDAKGAQLAKWGDATTLAQVVARVK